MDDLQPLRAGLPLGRSGAAFELDHPARANTRIRVGSWRVATAKGSAVVVARGRVSSYSSGLTAAMPRVEVALDKLAARGIDELALVNADHEHLVWWSAGDGTTLRIVSTSFLTMSVPELEVTVRDARGRIVRPPKPRPMPWHPSYRFFRLSQTTKDLFDAYRNAYLALESILADHAPQRRRGPGQRADEPDRAWFERALAATGVDLRAFIKAPKGTEAGAVYDKIYRGVRVRVFHAKGDRDVFLPRDRQVTTDVRAGIELTRRLYLAILKETLGVRRLTGGFTAHAIRIAAAASLEGVRVLATPDESELTAGEVIGVDPAATAIALPALGTAEYEGFTARLRCAIPGSELAGLPFVRRFVGIGPRGRVFECRLEGRLEPQRFSRVEVEFRLVARNRHDLAVELA